MNKIVKNLEEVKNRFLKCIKGMVSDDYASGYEEAVEHCVDAVSGFSCDGLTANEYQKAAMRTNDGKCTDRLQDKLDMIDFFKAANAGRKTEKYDLGGMLNASLGLSGEVGELNDVLKKWIFHGHEMNEAAVKKELGDVLWYVAMMCESFGFNMEEIMQMNIDKLKARYPEGFSEYASQHRKAGDI